MHETPMIRRYTTTIECEDDIYVALAPELDIASQGRSASEARNNLKEAIELFLESASPIEVQSRWDNQHFPE
jgi:predicted RNase H-like HicB family nuclease